MFGNIANIEPGGPAGQVWYTTLSWRRPRILAEYLVNVILKMDIS